MMIASKREGAGAGSGGRHRRAAVGGARSAVGGVGGRGGGGSGFPARGVRPGAAHRAARSASGFLKAWTYGVISDEINRVEIHGAPPRKVARVDEVAPDGRLIIPGGTFDDPIRHLYPIAAFLRDEAGLRLTWEVPDAGPDGDGYLGFVGQQDGWRCFLGGPITPQIWTALNARFVLPRNIVYWPAANTTTTGGGMIRDNDNWVDIMGTAEPPPADARRSETA